MVSIHPIVIAAAEFENDVLKTDWSMCTLPLWCQHYHKLTLRLLSLSALNHLAGVIKFIHMKERFQTDPFSVDKKMD